MRLLLLAGLFFSRTLRLSQLHLRCRYATSCSRNAGATAELEMMREPAGEEDDRCSFLLSSR